jgi:hypothetical protein
MLPVWVVGGVGRLFRLRFNDLIGQTKTATYEAKDEDEAVLLHNAVVRQQFIHAVWDGSRVVSFVVPT